jgi:uncharacterized protein DUF4440
VARLRFEWIALVVLAASERGMAQTEPALDPATARAIDRVTDQFERALAQRDRATLETLLATPFTWVHASDGRTETRAVWLAAAAQGTALTGQRTTRTEHGPLLTAYGRPEPTVVVRIARVQLVDSARARESWLRQTLVLVRGEDQSWRIASGQGTLMYEGPRLDRSLEARYVGTYALPDGRLLVLRWEDGGLFATLPNGATAQIFLGSPTEEVVRTTGAGRLRFTLGADGRPIAAALVRGETEVWRATRRDP